MHRRREAGYMYNAMPDNRRREAASPHSNTGIVGHDDLKGVIPVLL
jgi:hypothetical protein